MKYTEKSFSVGGSSKKFRDGWDSIWKKEDESEDEPTVSPEDEKKPEAQE